VYIERRASGPVLGSAPIEQVVSRLSLHSTTIDDLDDYKLEVLFQGDPECVLHTKFVSDRARGIRRVPVFQKWIPQKPLLGAGMFGSVGLEACLDPAKEVEHRAVKKLQKMYLDRLRIDFRKELIALTEFSRQKVKTHPLRYAVFFVENCLDFSCENHKFQLWDFT
jgi:hypothetical protein